MIAADIMTENVRFIRPEETISDAVELLQTLEVRHLPVVNEDDELVGMLSDRDLRALLVPFDEDGETAGSVLVQGRMPVSKVMSSNVAAVESEDSIWDVVDRMLEDKVGAVPVVDSENKLVGIISYVDILRNWQEDRPDGAPVHRSMPPHIKLGAKAAHAEKAHEEKASAKKAAPKKAPAKASAKSEKAPAKKASAKSEKAPAKASAKSEKAPAKMAAKAPAKAAKAPAKKAAAKKAAPKKAKRAR